MNWCNFQTLYVFYRYATQWIIRSNYKYIQYRKYKGKTLMYNKIIKLHFYKKLRHTITMLYLTIKYIKYEIKKVYNLHKMATCYDLVQFINIYNNKYFHEFCMDYLVFDKK